MLLGKVCAVSLPSGKNLTSRFSFKEVPIKVTGRRFLVDSIVLEIVEYTMILGVGWLSKYNVPFLCRRKKAVFQPSAGKVFNCKGTPRESKWLVVFTLKASKMLPKGCVGHFGEYPGYNKKVVTKLVDVRMICRFPDVFPEELPELPSNREIEFKIELLPGIEPISKAPNQIALVKLKELKHQPQELLDKNLFVSVIHCGELWCCL